MWYKRPKFKRSAGWSKVRNDFIKLHPACVICGIREMLEVHHCIPVHLDKDLELDTRNLIVLCEGPCNCHFVWGHLLNWSSYNPTVREDVRAFAEKILKRPYGRRE